MCGGDWRSGAAVAVWPRATVTRRSHSCDGVSQREYGDDRGNSESAGESRRDLARLHESLADTLSKMEGPQPLLCVFSNPDFRFESLFGVNIEAGFA